MSQTLRPDAMTNKAAVRGGRWNAAKAGWGVSEDENILEQSREVRRGTDHILLHLNCIDTGLAALCPFHLSARMCVFLQMLFAPHHSASSTCGGESPSDGALFPLSPLFPTQLQPDFHP